VSPLRQQLLDQLARFDEDAFVALANRGLFRRALKDLEKQAGALVDDRDDGLVVAIAEQRVSFDARGPAHARCTCPASGVCQHVVAAAITLQRLGAVAPAAADAATAPGAPEAPADALAPLRDALLALPAKALVAHAGRAGYRWAWQFVADLDPDNPLQIGGSAHLVLGFRRPRVSLRYMGGGVENLLADVELAQIEKYRVAAVLAFQLAHGRTPMPPEPSARERNAALDLGRDHALADLPAAALRESRERLRARTAQLIGECLELGLAHLSRGVCERFATLATWSQGAEYHRLALLLRRIADHVEQLLERAGGADEHLLFDELTLAYGLVAALEAAAARGAAPVQLVGRARSSYASVGTLELLGLGAWAWRSGSGYQGLTLLFWSADEQRFHACTDARPEGQRGFDPLARYKAAGPWSGLGAPAQATGRRLVLTDAQLNPAGRLSAADSVGATVLPALAPADFAAALAPQASWAALAQQRRDGQRSLLAEPEPMQDWAVLRPERFGAARFDANRQVLVWPLHDAQGQTLDAELAFSEFTRHAITRVEAMNAAPPRPGTLLVARLRQSADRLVAEPLSLVRTEGPAGQAAVDALHFDPAPEQGLVSRWLAAFKPRADSGGPGAAETRLTPALLPALLGEFRAALQRRAERGISSEQAPQWLAQLEAWAKRAGEAGFTSFGPAVAGPVVVATLRANYLCLQFERLIVGAEPTQE